MTVSEVEVVPASDSDSPSESEVQETSGKTNITVVFVLDQLKLQSNPAFPQSRM